MDDVMCKLHVKLQPEPGGPAVESLWALVIDRGRVKVNNIPFYTNEIAMGDIVECDDEGNYLQVVEPGGFWTVQGVAEANEYADGRESCLAMKKYFRDQGIENETNWGPSNPRQWLFALAVPYELNHDQLQDIAAGAPVTIIGLHCGNDPARGC